MANRGMFSTTDLRPLLEQRGVQLSVSQVYRLVTEKPERLNIKVLLALLDILGCRMDELIEPVPVATAAPATRPRRAAAGGATDAGAEPGGVGSFRPKRARVIE
jgi:DNA-binding Xre family transcriptional regulator